MFQWKLQFCLVMIIGLQSGKNALIEFVVVFFFEKTLPSCAPDEGLGVQWSQAFEPFTVLFRPVQPFFKDFSSGRWIHDQKEFVTSCPIHPSFHPSESTCQN